MEADDLRSWPLRKHLKKGASSVFHCLIFDSTCSSASVAAVSFLSLCFALFHFLCQLCFLPFGPCWLLLQVCYPFPPCVSHFQYTVVKETKLLSYYRCQNAILFKFQSLKPQEIRESSFRVSKSSFRSSVSLSGPANANESFHIFFYLMAFKLLKTSSIKQEPAHLTHRIGSFHLFTMPLDSKQVRANWNDPETPVSFLIQLPLF